jgi:hypothetical protein
MLRDFHAVVSAAKTTETADKAQVIIFLSVNILERNATMSVGVIDQNCGDASGEISRSLYTQAPFTVRNLLTSTINPQKGKMTDVS